MLNFKCFSIGDLFSHFVAPHPLHYSLGSIHLLRGLDQELLKCIYVLIRHYKSPIFKFESNLFQLRRQRLISQHYHPPHFHPQNRSHIRHHH